MAPRSELSGLGLATILVGAFLSIADFFIVNVALPTISSDLHTSAAMLQLVVAGYGIPYALLLVLGGRLGDLYGRRRLFMLGMSSFTLFSLLCGIAPTDGRWSRSAPPRAHRRPSWSRRRSRRSSRRRPASERSRARAVRGDRRGGRGRRPAGRWRDRAANFGGESWRPIFLVNVPIGLVGLVLAWRNVPSTHAENPRGRPPGTGLLGVALLALLLPLTEGRTLGWPVWSWSCSRSPLRQRDVLRGRGPAGTVRAASDRAADPASAARHAPRAPDHDAVLRRVRDVHVRQRAHAAERRRFQRARLGVALVPLGVAFLGASLATARLTARFGSRWSPWARWCRASACSVAATFLAAWPKSTRSSSLPPWRRGLGQGLVVSPLFGFVLGGVPAERAQLAAGSSRRPCSPLSRSESRVSAASSSR